MPVVTGVVAPVVETVTPVVTDMVAPLVSEVVTPIVTEVVQPVVEVVTPLVTEVVAPVVTEVVAPVVETVAPVISEEIMRAVWVSTGSGLTCRSPKAGSAAGLLSGPAKFCQPNITWIRGWWVRDRVGLSRSTSTSKGTSWCS